MRVTLGDGQWHAGIAGADRLLVSYDVPDLRTALSRDPRQPQDSARPTAKPCCSAPRSPRRCLSPHAGAGAGVDCPQPVSTDPIAYGPGVILSITCVNTEPRTANGTYPDAIYLATPGAGNYVDLYNRGELTANLTVDDVSGIRTLATGGGNEIDIVNLGEVNGGSINARGIDARTDGGGGDLRIENHGDFVVTGDGIDSALSLGIYARAAGGGASFASRTTAISR